MAYVADPVGTGLVPSLARPGGNLTGVSDMATDLSAKRLELLKEAVPTLSRIAVLRNAADPGMVLRFREIEAAFAAMAQERPDALFVVAEVLTLTHRCRILDFAAQHRLPAKIDAYLGFPPEPQELRAKRIGHVVVNSAVDRPWSQYFCCMVAGNREFIRQHPNATKRRLHAFLKATDVCAREPARVARYLVDQGYTKHDEYLLQEIPFDKWREYDSEDTVRFYALRLHEIGLMKSTPQKLIAQGTDWRFLNELKRELKG